MVYSNNRNKEGTAERAERHKVMKREELRNVKINILLKKWDFNFSPSVQAVGRVRRPAAVFPFKG